MSSGLYIVVRCALLFLDIINLAMLVRAVLSWFTMGEPTKFSTFIYVVTEPVILPVRSLCDQFGWFRGLPMDMPFFITTILIIILRVFLEAVIG